MPFRGFGYAVPMFGSPADLAERLQMLADIGYDYVEFLPESWDIWLGGRVNHRRLKELTDVLDKFRDRLGYTMHLPGDTNMFDLDDREMHENLLQAGLEVGKAVGAVAMAYHCGRRGQPPVGSSVAMQDLMAREREILLSHADEIASWDGNLAIETMPSVASINYTYAFWPELLAQQVEQINHPAIGLCIDFGHVWISARWLGYDFLAGIERLAPLTTHFHINDNMGVSDYTGKSVNLGRGDLHLPPGWGTIPFEEVFRTIDFPKNPVFLMEHSHGRWLSRAEEILVEAKRLAALR